MTPRRDRNCIPPPPPDDEVAPVIHALVSEIPKSMPPSAKWGAVAAMHLETQRPGAKKERRFRLSEEREVSAGGYEEAALKAAQYFYLKEAVRRHTGEPGRMGKFEAHDIGEAKGIFFQLAEVI